VKSEQPVSSMPHRGSTNQALSADVSKAEARFRRMSTVAQQRVIAELLETRGGELLQAFPDLLALGSGRRRRRHRRNEATGAIHGKEWCVLFLVEYKWRSTREEERTRSLPSHLLCFETIRGRRQLLAVPTDVDEIKPVESQAGATRAVDVISDRQSVKGAITCLVRCRREDGTRTWRALSCLHLLGMTNGRSGGVEGASVSHKGKTLGHSSIVRGSITPNQSDGFDAQAMEVDDLEATKNVLWTWQWNRGFVTFAGEFTQQLWLHLPGRDNPVPATYRGVWTQYGIGYGPSSDRFVCSVGPLVEVELESAASTVEGDSGSPLVIGYSRPKLAGMHIAGRHDKAARKYISFCIPAYALLDPSLYSGAAGETWSLP